MLWNTRVSSIQNCIKHVKKKKRFLMKAQLKIVEKDGFISSINGVEQVPAENKYWLFDVNGTMSPVGAKEVILKAGDVIDWKLNKLQ